MNTIKLYLPALLIMATLLSSCKEEDNALRYKSQGFIKGTISGTLSDDETAFDGSFRYTQYIIDTYNFPYYYIDPDNGSVSLYLFRQDIALGASASWGIYLEDETDTEPAEAYLFLNHVIESSTQLLSLSLSTGLEIDDFSFDPATGRVKGTFSFTTTNTTSGNEATVEGSFDVIAKRSYYRNNS